MDHGRIMEYEPAIMGIYGDIVHIVGNNHGRGHHWDGLKEHLHFTSQKNGFRSFQYPSNLYEW